MATWRLENGEEIRLLTIPEFEALPKGTEVISIFGDPHVKGTHDIDMDTRCGFIAFGFPVPKEKA